MDLICISDHWLGFANNKSLIIDFILILYSNLSFFNWRFKEQWGEWEDEKSNGIKLDWNFLRMYIYSSETWDRRDWENGDLKRETLTLRLTQPSIIFEASTTLILSVHSFAPFPSLPSLLLLLPCFSSSKSRLPLQLHLYILNPKNYSKSTRLNSTPSSLLTSHHYNNYLRLTQVEFTKVRNAKSKNQNTPRRK